MKNAWKKFGKRLFSWFLCVALVVGLMPEMEMPSVKAATSEDDIVWNDKDGRYEIKSYAGLKEFADIVNGTGKYADNANMIAKAILMDDIDASASANYETNPDNAWTPIGSPYSPYYGTFYGNNHVILNLTIYQPSTDDVGLFGYLGEGALVQNVGLVGGSVYGQSCVGGIAGYSKGRIDQCYNTGEVNGVCDYVGGLVGNLIGRILNCYNTGSVKGDLNVGGIVGKSVGYQIDNCYNTGDISGRKWIGGIAGYAKQGIRYCYNGGNITNVETSNADEIGLIGGIVGENNYGVVNYCYNFGTISGHDNVGGVAGDSKNEISMCYNYGTVKGVNNIGGVAGDNNGVVSRCYNRGTVKGVNNVGGVAGHETDHGLRYSYNLGDVSGSNYVGGIFGFSEKYSLSNYNRYVIYCYNIGSVHGEQNVGGIAGEGISVVEKCYYDTDLCGIIGAVAGEDYDSKNVMGLPALEMRGSALSSKLMPAGSQDPIWLFYDSYDGFAYYPHLSGFDLTADGKQMSANDIITTGKWPAVFGSGWDSSTAVAQADDNGVKWYYQLDYTKTEAIVYGADPAIGDLVMPATLGGKPVTVIAPAAFSAKEQYQGMTSITLPSTVSRIESGAFKNCVGLMKIMLPSGLNAIADHAFDGCESLSTICYAGCENDWKKISKGEDWNANTNLTDASMKFQKKTVRFLVVNGAWLDGTIDPRELELDGYDAKLKADQIPAVSMLTSNDVGVGSWDITPDTETPINKDTTYVLSYYDNTMPGDGSAEHPYQISNYAQLQRFSVIVNGLQDYEGKAEPGANAILTANIDASVSADYEEKPYTAWIPIGKTNWYEGTFDGYNFTISNLLINLPSSDDVGLFVHVGDGGTIRNLSMENGSITGRNRVGSIAGYSKGCIENCSNSGIVKGTDSYVGGIVGLNEGSQKEFTIRNCYNSGAISGNQFVGGIVGKNNKNRILEECQNTGAVNGNHYVGGIAGENLETVKNCSNVGAVSSTDDGVGGIVGHLGDFDTRQRTVEYCYNTGDVSGQKDAGGIVGLNEGDVLHCYNTGNVKGTMYVGGLAGRLKLAGVKYSYNIGAVNGEKYVGGVFGYYQYNDESYSSGYVIYCYNIGLVSGKENIGGVAGWGISIAQNCIYDKQLCGDIGAISGKDYKSWKVQGIPTLWFQPNQQVISTYLIDKSYSHPNWLHYLNNTEYKFYPHLTGFDLDDEGNQMSAEDIVKAGRWPAKTVLGYVVSIPGDPLVYNGTEQFPEVKVEKNGVVADPSEYKITFPFESINAGTYSFTVSIPGQFAYTTGTYEIRRAAPALTNEQRAAAKEGLEVNGSDQELITAPSAIPEGYVGIEYSTDNGENWSEEIPTGNEAGEYVIKVRYVGDNNHEDINETLTVTIMAPIPDIEWNEKENRYEIWTYAGLQEFSDIVNSKGKYEDELHTSANAKLMRDIDASESANYETDPGKAWTPIGGCIVSFTHNNVSSSFITYYEGMFDGDNHAIKNLVINNSNSDYVGLFGYLKKNGTVQNLYIEGGSVTGKQKYTGGIVAFMQDGTIINCHSSATVTGKDYVGGVVGYAGLSESYGDAIKNCSNAGTVTGSSSVGGVVGATNQYNVTNCYNTGNISANKVAYVGGVAGSIEGFSAVQACYNTGEITGTGNVACVGGVIGYNGDGSGSAQNCFNEGTVTAMGDIIAIGGIAGVIFDVKNSYSIGTIIATGVTNSVGGIVGHGEQCKNCYFDQDACAISLNGAMVANEEKKAIGTSEESSSSGKLTTTDMTGARALNNMNFDGAVWLTNDNDSDLGVAYYPILKGFDFNDSGEQMSAEEIVKAGNWPAKAALGYEVTVSGGALTYNGKDQLSSVAIAKDGKNLNASDYRIEGLTEAINAGTYSFKYTILSTGAIAGGTFEIQKADAPTLAIEYKPDAKFGLEANGTEQELLFGPFAPPEGYTAIEYSTDNGKNWSDKIPTGKEVGKYFVLVRYIGDQNHKDFDGETLMVTIDAPSAGILWNEKEKRYEIWSYIGLKKFADIVNGMGDYAENANMSANAVLMADIECKNDPDDSEYATDWYPIGDGLGSDDTRKLYVGNFDGQGHVIKGLNNSSNGTASFAGLFGNIGIDGTVQRVGLEDGSITGSRYVGSVAGYNHGTVSRCYNTGSVTGSDALSIGGLMGFNGDDGQIVECYNTGSVTGSDAWYIGGLVGGNYRGSSITASYNVGPVTCVGNNTRVGGVIGNGSLDKVDAVYFDGVNCIITLNGTVLGESATAVGTSSEDTGTVSRLTTEEMSGSGLETRFKPADSQETCWLYAENVKDDAEGKITYFYPHLKGFNLTDDGKQMDAKGIVKAGEWPAYTEVELPKHEITVIAASNTGNVYDGTEKSANGFETLEFTVDGNVYTVSGLTTSDPSSTSVCKLTNAISGTAVVKNADGNDVTSQFTIKFENGTLEIKQREVSVSVADKSAEYDGAPQQGRTDYTFANLVSGQTATITYAPATGTAAQNDAYDNGSFDEKTLHVTDGSGNDVTGNYVLTTMTAGKLTIRPSTKAIEITSETKSWTYDGENHVGDTYVVTYDGTEMAVNRSGKVFTATLPTGDEITITPTTTGVRDYDETYSWNNTFSYELENSNLYTNVTASFGTLSITKCEVTVSVGDKEAEYDGSEQWGETACVFSNVVSGHAATVTYTPAKGTLVDTSTGSFTEGTFKVTDASGGDVTGNYVLTTMTAGRLTIKDRSDKYEITVVANSSTGNVYDGTEKSVSGFEKLTFQVNGKTYSVEGLTTSNPSSKDACNLTNAIIGTAVVKDSAGNDVTAQFTVTIQDGTLEIKQREATVSVDGETVEYSGKEQYGKADYTFKNLVGGHVATITYTPAQGTLAATYDNGSFDESTFKVMNGEKDVTANYELTTMTKGKLTIKDRSDKYEITVVANSSIKNVYDGTEKRVSGFETLEFTVNGNIYTVSGLTTSNPSSTNVCDLKNVISGTAVVKDAAGNDVTAQFTVTTQDGKLEVTPASVTITAGSNAKVYDGTALTKDSASSMGLAGGDKVESITVTGSQTIVGNSENVPSDAKIVNGDGKDVTGCYDITYENGTLEVTKKSVTVTADSETKAYDGTALTKDSYTNTGLTFGDRVQSVTVTGSQTIVGASENIPSDAKIVNRAGADVTGCYQISYINGTLEVTKKSVTVTADSAAKEYDGTALTKNSYTNTGLAFGDMVQSVTVTGSQTIVGDCENVPSEAKIVNLNGEDATPNYEITYQSGTLEIKQRGVTVSVSDKSVEYNGNEQSGNTACQFDNLVSGHAASIAYVPAKGRIAQTYYGSFDKDTFKITDAAGNDVTGNYDLTAMTAGKLTVTDRTEKYVITVKSNGNAGNVYDGTEKKAAGIENLKFTVEGNEYTVEGLYSHDPSSTNVCNLANVILGTAVVKDAFGNDVTAQFEVRKAEGRLEIRPRPATITVDSKRKELRNPDPKFTATVTGLVDGDVLDYELVREEGEEPGTYAITAKVTADENYDVTVVDGMLIINEDYLNELRKKLQEAISRGGEQTVTWNKGTALPYDVMKTLEDHPQITLIFSYSYQGTDYQVTIPGKSARAYTTISWYGPLYLNDVYNNAANHTAGGDSNLGSRIYKVVKGDCLSRIARRLGLRWRWLANFNNLKNPNLIFPGQELRY